MGTGLRKGASNVPQDVPYLPFTSMHAFGEARVSYALCPVTRKNQHANQFPPPPALCTAGRSTVLQGLRCCLRQADGTGMQAVSAYCQGSAVQIEGENRGESGRTPNIKGGKGKG